MNGEDQMEIFVCRGEEEFGPYSPAELRDRMDAGELLPDDHAWWEGEAEWIPLTDVEAVLAVVSAEAEDVPAEVEEDTGASPPVETTVKATGIQLGKTASTAPVPEVAAASAASIPATAPEGVVFFPHGLHRVNAIPYWSYIVPWVLFPLGVGLALLGDWIDSVWVEFFGYVIAPVGLVWSTAMRCMILHRAWKAIQGGDVRTRPGEAVARWLCLPVNIFWVFQIFPGFVKDYETTTKNASQAPRCSKRVFKAYAFLQAIVLAGVLLFTPMFLLFDLLGVTDFLLYVLYGLGACLVLALFFETVVYHDLAQVIRWASDETRSGTHGTRGARGAARNGHSRNQPPHPMAWSVARIAGPIALGLGAVLLGFGLDFARVEGMREWSQWVVLLVSFSVFWLVVEWLLMLARGWEVVGRDDPHRAISPEAAAGFHLIPFFNLAWIWTAGPGLAAALNRVSKKRVWEPLWRGMLALFLIPIPLLLGVSIVESIREQARAATSYWDSRAQHRDFSYALNDLYEWLGIGSAVLVVLALLVGVVIAVQVTGALRERVDAQRATVREARRGESA